MPANSRWDLIQRLRVKIVKNPGNGRLNNLNDLVLNVLILFFSPVLLPHDSSEWLGHLSPIEDSLTSKMLKEEVPGRYMCFGSRFQYILRKLAFTLLEVLNLYYILPYVVLCIFPPSVSLFRFLTRIICNIQHQ